MRHSSPIRLSIVTVCRNDLSNVQRTMECLQRQTERNGWEHVLVDGDSTDGTADWYRCADFAFPNRVLSEPDSGIFDAMNKSLDILTGDYVVFMNAGDRYVDDAAVGRVLHRIDTRPQWGYSKARVVDLESRNHRSQIIGTMPYSRIRHLFSIGQICHQAVVMRVDFLRDLGKFDLSMGFAADYHLLIKAASRASPVTWPDVDVEYLAGGVSDLGILDGLWLGHRSRVDALELKPLGTRLDRVWTSWQVWNIRARKSLKPLIEPALLRIRR